MSLVSLKSAKADAVAKAEGNILVIDGILPEFRRGRRAAHACTEVTLTKGVIQKPGRPFYFHKDRIPGKRTRIPIPGLLWGVCQRHNGSEDPGTLCGIQRTKETKLEEMGERELECPILPVNQGNLPEGTLRRKRDTVSWTL